MSVYSMTGYASGQQAASAGPDGTPAWKTPQARLGLELRSVNSRFLDLGFRLSDELRPHEPALRELLTQRIKRGKVELRAYLQGQSAGALTDHALYAEVATDLKIALQREAWAEVLAQPELRADPVHANASGYAQFARRLQTTALAVGLLAP